MTDHPAYPSDRSERARQLVAEGRIGGAGRGQGRPRKPRPTELAAESARQHWSSIEDALLTGVTAGTVEQRSRAAERWLRLALGEGTLQVRERAEDRADEYAAMSDDEVRARFAGELIAMIRRGEIPAAALLAELPVAMDAEALEVDVELDS
ncbi:MAG TPA: hypothetical protein VI318_16435 [Baekduia sp.]